MLRKIVRRTLSLLRAPIQNTPTVVEVYRPKAGTVLIWHENLMHAGSIREDLTKSRKSIVCHYFAEGVVGYYDSSATPGAMQLDERV